MGLRGARSFEGVASSKLNDRSLRPLSFLFGELRQTGFATFAKQK